MSIVNNISVGTSDKLVSFDVESLFTNILVKETLRIIKKAGYTKIDYSKTGLNLISILLYICVSMVILSLEEL